MPDTTQVPNQIANKPTAIGVHSVSKSFRLPHEKTASVKGALVNVFKKNKTYETQHVLKDVSFEIKEGEFFGIVGRNGSGKSTLLKLLAGIYSPDTGNINVNGKITPFIELGVGFSPELTGRENVFLNGALLGFSRKEMAQLYDGIVEFAELEKFMDQKLKNYSSGMQVRLAFSIAIQAKSDILILDEVLAVGDEAFQAKCTSIFEQYKARKQTIVLVTHDMGVVEKFCSRAMMLKDGDIVKIGSPSVVARFYSEANKSDYATQNEKRDDAVNRTDFKVSILDKDTRRKRNRFKQNETALICLEWEREDVRNVGVAIMKQSGEYIFGPNTDEGKFKIKKGTKKIYYEVELSLGRGDYYLKAGLFDDDMKESLDFIDDGPTLIVEPDKEEKWGGVTKLKHKWIYLDDATN